MARGPKGHLYEAKDGIRWHLKSGNGNIIAESGEAYDEERKAIKGFDRAFEGRHPLVLLDGTEMPATIPDGMQPVGAAAASTAGDGFSGLPQDPNHPLYSPLTVDGNK